MSTEIVFRYRDTQLERLCDLGGLNMLKLNIYQCFNIEGIFYF